MAFSYANVGTITNSNFYETNEITHLNVYLTSDLQATQVLKTLVPSCSRSQQPSSCDPRNHEPSRQPVPTAVISRTPPSESLDLDPPSKSNAKEVLDLVWALKLIVKPHNANVLKKFGQDLDLLERMVQFASLAYCACRGTKIGRVICAELAKQFSQSHSILRRVFERTCTILSTWVALWSCTSRWMPTRVVESVLGLVGEPADISSVRFEIWQQIEGLGECIGSLKSFHWLFQLVPFCTEGGSEGLSSQKLDDFFNSGPPSLRHLVVEEIYIVDPFGEKLTFPTRFIEEFQNIHLFLQEGCKRTIACRYIKAGQYRLDNSKTNLPFTSKHIQGTIRPGTVLEVSILVQNIGLQDDERTRCPRPGCGRLTTADEEGVGFPTRNGWVKCSGCKLFFNGIESPGASIPDLMDNNGSLNTTTTLQSPGSSPLETRGRDSVQVETPPAEHATCSQQWTLFRRIIVNCVRTRTKGNLATSKGSSKNSSTFGLPGNFQSVIWRMMRSASKIRRPFFARSTAIVKSWYRLSFSGAPGIEKDEGKLQWNIDRTLELFDKSSKLDHDDIVQYISELGRLYETLVEELGALLDRYVKEQSVRLRTDYREAARVDQLCIDRLSTSRDCRKGL